MVDKGHLAGDWFGIAQTHRPTIISQSSGAKSTQEADADTG